MRQFAQKIWIAFVAVGGVTGCPGGVAGPSTPASPPVPANRPAGLNANEPVTADELKIGVLTLVPQNRVMAVTGSDLQVTNLGAQMAHAADANNPAADFHYIMADLRLSMGGEKATFAMTSGAPVSWRGFRIWITELGFSWSEATVAVLVERIPSPSP